MQRVLERLAAEGFHLVPSEDLRGHFLFERAGYLALVEATPSGLGSVGNPGILTEKGFAVLVRQDGGFAFVAKGLALPASQEQVAQVRQFTRDLRAALAG
jgi:hypothetical protein